MFKSAFTVIAGVSVAAGLTAVRKLFDGSPSEAMKPIVSGFIVGAVLLMLAIFSNAIASALAVMLLLSSVLLNGEAVMQAVGEL